MKRAEFGNSCPVGFTGNSAPHRWIETTMPQAGKRRFGCDYCPAWADEPLSKAIADAIPSLKSGGTDAS